MKKNFGINLLIVLFCGKVIQLSRQLVEKDLKAELLVKATNTLI